MLKKKFVLVVVFFILICFNPVLAQQELREETLTARINRVIEEKEIEVMENNQLYQKLELLITKGSLKDEVIIIENGSVPASNQQKFKAGERILVTLSNDSQGNKHLQIIDYVRSDVLIFLFLAFMLLTLTVAKKKGVASILSMGFSFLIIFIFILPQILNGTNPVLVAILGSVIIIPVSFYLSHGFNKKTTTAFIGTLISLIITIILATISIEVAKLTGFATEEASFLESNRQGLINIKGLLLAGIIIGSLGVLDDITISQSAIVFQLKEANPKIKKGELYKRAMTVGKDHISSMVNTLVLVYTGAALPLLLLFIDNPKPFSEVINNEIVADEIVRTLVGSIGLILAVPITTVLATLWSRNKIKIKI